MRPGLRTWVTRTGPKVRRQKISGVDTGLGGWQESRRLHPICAQQLGLHEHGLDCFFLQVRWVAVTKAATIFKVSVPTMRRWVKRGQVPVVKVQTMPKIGAAVFLQPGTGQNCFGLVFFLLPDEARCHRMDVHRLERDVALNLLPAPALGM